MLKNTVLQIIQYLRVLSASWHLHSYHWGKRLAGRDLAPFDVRTKGYLHFKAISVEPPDAVAETLLGQYGKVNMLAKCCGVTFCWSEETLKAQYKEAVFPISTQEELYILHELIAESIYTYKVSEPCVVMDIGMNVGFASILFAQQPDTQVVAFEPFRPTYLIAQENLRENPHVAGRVKAFNYGLSDSDAETTWEYVESKRGMCGCFARSEGKKTTRETVRLRRASEVVDEVSQAYPHRALIMKVDCEGSEHLIIPELITSGKIKKVNLLMMEWHRMGDLQPASLVTQLIGANFMVTCRGSMACESGMIYAFNTCSETTKPSPALPHPPLVTG